MFKISFPFTDTILLVFPRDMSVPGLIGIALFCILVPAVLVLLYRYELKLVRPLTATFLLTLRLLTIFFLLIVVFVQPIIARTKTEELQGRVLIAIDRSDSMKMGDPQRPPAEKLRLARALKIYSDICGAKQLDRWIEQHEQQGGPVWIEKDEYPDNPQKRRELAESRRKQHEQLCERVDRLSRLGVTQKILSADGLGLLPSISRKHNVELLGFAQNDWDVKADELSELLTPYAGAPDPKKAGKDREKVKEKDKGKEDKSAKESKDKKERGADDGTDLRLPLIRARERSGKGEGRVGNILGVILFTDGQHNKDSGGPTPVARAIELKQQGVPIYPVALGAKLAPPDVAIASVRAPSVAFKDVDLPVEVRLKVSGLPKQELLVELETTDGNPPLQEHVKHEGTDQYYTVRFQVRLEQAGMQLLTVTAKPVAGEVREDNNSRPIAVNVAADKAKALLVDGEARWEFHYLANAMLRDRTMQVHSVVFTQPRVGKVPENELEKYGNPFTQWPTDADALAGYDCIVLGDLPPSQLPLTERTRLEKFVSERGGTLVILAGKRYMPMAYTELEGVVSQPSERDADKESLDPLLKLLPILEPHVIRPVKGFPVTLTPAGKLSPFMQMDPTPEKSPARWAELPRHYWAVIGRAKPAAIPLAYVASEDLSGLVEEKESPEKDPGRTHALIVRQNYGFGRVLYVGLESTWRWRYRVGDTYHHRFWGQVMRWAAADKPLITGNDHIRFGAREPIYREGQDIDLVCRLGDKEKPLGAAALVGARILRTADAGKEPDPGKEEAVGLVQMKQHPAQPRVLEGRIFDLPAGQYAIELAIPDMADKLQGPIGADGKPGKLRAPFSVLPVESEETIELATNGPLLEELATKSGGKTFTPENVQELVEVLTKKPLTRDLYIENKLWENWGSLLFFLGLLTIEWITRKFSGLP